jgi:hypothetical protein
VLSNTGAARPATLSRITSIADELAQTHPDARELVRELFGLAVALVHEDRRPQTIETVPRSFDRKLLLYSPSQGGWHVGEWAGARWVDGWTLDFLHPTHWTEIPDEPEPSL